MLLIVEQREQREQREQDEERGERSEVRGQWLEVV
jgi:hypothetical protein